MGKLALTCVLLTAALAGCGADAKSPEGLREAMKEAGFVTESALVTQFDLDLTLTMVCDTVESAQSSARNLTKGTREAQVQAVRVGYACPEMLPKWEAALSQ